MDCACVRVDAMEPLLEIEKEMLIAGENPIHCCECDRWIKEGEEFEHFVGSEDDEEDREYEIYNTCADCKSLRDAFFCRGFIFTTTWEDFNYFVEDCRAEINFSNIALLTPKVREKVCAIVEEVWELVEAEEQNNE